MATYSDDFNRANTNVGDPIAGWTDVGSWPQWKLQSGQLKFEGTGAGRTGYLRFDTVLNSFDQRVQFTIPTYTPAGSDERPLLTPILRFDPAGNNRYEIRFRTGTGALQLDVFRLRNNSGTVIASFSPITFAVGGVCVAEVIGDRITVWYDGTQLVSVVDPLPPVWVDPKSYVALSAYVNNAAQSAYFDDFIITTLDPVQIIRPTARSTNVQTFTASGTWLKPDGAREVNVICIGGGGGGGSGRKGAAGTSRTGGGGGSGGAYSQAVFDAEVLASSVSISIGAGGVGASGPATDDTNGTAGSVGGSSSFGPYLVAVGGNGGGGGAAGSGGGGGAATTGPQTDAAGAGGSANAGGGAAGAGASVNASRAPTGGGGGGGITNVNNNGASGNGGIHNIYGAITGASATGGTGPTVAGFIGLGGAGSHATVPQTPGGNGGLYGGGAGGGTAALNGTTLTGGGNGAQGIVIVTTIF